MSTHPTESNVFHPTELSAMMTDQVILDRLSEGFASDPTSTALLRHLGFLSYTIRRLEEDLEVHRRERDEAFVFATAKEDFRRALRPIIREYRNRRTHPYRRPTPSSSSSPPSPPIPPSPLSNENENLSQSTNLSSTNDDEPPPSNPPSSNSSRENVGTPHPATGVLQRRLSEELHLTRSISPASSYHSADDEIPGSQSNPIPVEEDEEEKCTRCNKEGHSRDDCDELRKPLRRCIICDWKREPQMNCLHYEYSPGWAKRQKTRLRLPE
jgi:hypothetical protein